MLSVRFETRVSQIDLGHSFNVSVKISCAVMIKLVLIKCKGVGKSCNFRPIDQKTDARYSYRLDVRPSVCLSVCHTLVLCQNGSTYRQLSSLPSPMILVF